MKHSSAAATSSAPAPSARGDRSSLARAIDNSGTKSPFAHWQLPAPITMREMA